MTTIAPVSATGTTSGVSLTDALPYVDVDQLVEQVQVLHGGAEGAVCMVRMDADRSVGATPHVWAPTIPAGDGRAIFDDTMRRAWRNCLVWGSARWNMYVAVSTFDKPEGKGKDGRPLGYSRQAKHVREVSGFFADLDLKPGTEGHFQSRQELEAFLGQLPVPTMLVETGSGGLHPYWLTQTRLPGGRATERLMNGWHDFMQEQAGLVVLDHVTEPARVLRLAGTVRWSKKDELMAGWPAFTRVQLKYANGPRYAIEELTSLAKDAFQRGEERRTSMREGFKSERQQAISSLEERGLPRDSRAYLEQQLNTRQDWAGLLEKAGWTLVSDGRDGSGHARDCRSWRRPGLGEGAHNSASTDWGESNLMTLYSNDPAVAGLADLSIPSGRFRHTTKYRFALIALYGGDEGALLLDIKKNDGVLV